jgi:hypothetical protein
MEIILSQLSEDITLKDSEALHWSPQDLKRVFITVSYIRSVYKQGSKLWDALSHYVDIQML